MIKKFNPPIRLKQFLASEAMRIGKSAASVYQMVRTGKIKTELKRANQRLIFVCSAAIAEQVKIDGAVTMKEFTMIESERLGIKPNSIASRIIRGKYSNLKIRRINSRVVFVSTKQPVSNL